MNVHLDTQNVFSSPKDYLCLNIFIVGLKLHFREFLYSATMADIEVSFSPTLTGIQVNVAGYNHQLDVFVEELSNRVGHFCKAEGKLRDTLQEKFPLLKTKRNEQLKNDFMNTPCKQFSTMSTFTFYTGMHSLEIQMENLKTLTFEEYFEFHQNVLLKGYTETLITGNLEESQAIAIENLFLKGFTEQGLLTGLPIKGITERKILALNKESVVVFAKQLVNPKETNGMMAMVFQSPQDSSLRYVNNLLEKLLASAFFTDLRTQQQLGYIVFAFKSSKKNIQEFSFLIQSEKLLPSELAIKTYEFLDKTRKRIGTLPDKIFEEFRQGALGPFQQEFNSLSDQSDFLLTEIDNHEYQFGRKEEAIAILNSLSKEDLIKHFEQMFYGGRKVIEFHLANEKNFGPNLAHLESRKKGEDPAKHSFGELPITVYRTGAELQKDHSLHPDVFLKRNQYQDIVN